MADEMYVNVNGTPTLVELPPSNMPLIAGRVTALENGKLDKSGGTMTGDVTMLDGTSSIITNGTAVRNISSENSTNIAGGTDINDGAALILRGSSQDVASGRFELISRTEANNGAALIGDMNGSLTWHSRDVCLVPQYSAGIYGGPVYADQHITCDRTSQVVVWGTDPYVVDVKAYVHDLNGNSFVVGFFYTDEFEGHTKGASMSFIVPAGWAFSAGFEQGFYFVKYPVTAN